MIVKKVITGFYKHQSFTDTIMVANTSLELFASFCLLGGELEKTEKNSLDPLFSSINSTEDNGG